MQDQLRALKLQVELNLEILLKSDMATTKWLVRHASCIICRFAVSKALKRTAYFRVFNKNHSGTMVNLFETVLARRAEDVLEGRKTSKWDSRLCVGAWLGKTEVSDEHLLHTAGEVTHHRTVRPKMAERGCLGNASHTLVHQGDGGVRTAEHSRYDSCT